jgi:hypothetical protein
MSLPGTRKVSVASPGQWTAAGPAAGSESQVKIPAAAPGRHCPLPRPKSSAKGCKLSITVTMMIWPGRPGGDRDVPSHRGAGVIPGARPAPVPWLGIDPSRRPGLGRRLGRDSKIVMIGFGCRARAAEVCSVQACQCANAPAVTVCRERTRHRENQVASAFLRSESRAPGPGPGRRWPVHGPLSLCLVVPVLRRGAAAARPPSPSPAAGFVQR